MDIHVREAVPTDAGRSAPCTIGRGWRRVHRADRPGLSAKHERRKERGDVPKAKLPGDPCRRGGRAGRRLLCGYGAARDADAPAGFGRSAVFTSCGRTSAAASGKACWPARRRRSGRRGSGKRTSGFCAKMTARSVYGGTGSNSTVWKKTDIRAVPIHESDTAARFEKAPQGPAVQTAAGSAALFYFRGGFLHDEARLDAVVPEAAQRVFYRSARRTRRSGSPAGSRHWRSRARGRDSFPPAAARWGKHGAARRRGAARGAAGSGGAVKIGGRRSTAHSARSRRPKSSGAVLRGEHRDEVVGVVKFKEDVRFAQPCGKRVARIAEGFRRERQLSSARGAARSRAI